ncbi:MAG: hypothetical protein IJY82_02365 [Oscillospiraceae bacterium]|nr:hypothetical protein [Oscillospiraceae bacterium]
MKKIFTAMILVLTLGILSGCSLGTSAPENTSPAPYGYEALTGCWVGENEGLVGAIQFFSDGAYVMKTSTGYRISTDTGMYYTEQDGTIRMDLSSNTAKIGTYELSEKTLIITFEKDKVQRFTRFEKNINYVDFKLKEENVY